MIILAPNTKHVGPDGILVGSSASAIESFNENSAFGCNRKWWFQGVAGLEAPQGEAAALGESVHAQIDHYLTTHQDALGKEARAGKGIIDELLTKYPLYQVEQWIPKGFEIEGVAIRGRLDFIGRIPGEGKIANITDWKTSSDYKRWGKTPYQLKKDTQMLVYRAFAEAEGCEENLPMNHVYFGTKKREAEIVSTTINREQLAEGLGVIKELLGGMKTVSKVLDSEYVKPNYKNCNTGTKIECPFHSQCHTKEQSMTSLMDRFKKAVNPPHLSPAVFPQVLPPDAPKSNPKLAADPVPNFEPLPRSLRSTPPAQPERHASVPEAPVIVAREAGVTTSPPKRVGRPPGSKNKVNQPAPDLVPVAPANFVALKYEEISITHGLTVNMGNYNSVRVDVSLKAAIIDGRTEEAQAMLSKKVMEALEKELENYPTTAAK